MTITTTKTKKPTTRETRTRKSRIAKNKNTDNSKYSQNSKTPKGSKQYQQGKTSLITLLMKKLFSKSKTRRISPKRLNLLNGAGRFLLFYFALVGFIATIGGVAEIADHSLKQVIDLKDTTVELVRGDR